MVAWSRFIHDSPMHTPRGEGFNQRWGQGLEDDALGNLIGNGHGLHPLNASSEKRESPRFSASREVFWKRMSLGGSQAHGRSNRAHRCWIGGNARLEVRADDFNEQFAFLPCDAQGRLLGDEGTPWMHHVPLLNEEVLLAALRGCRLVNRPEMSLDDLLLQDHAAAAGASWYQPPLPQGIRGVISVAPLPELLQSTSLALLWDLATRNHGLATPPQRRRGGLSSLLAGSGGEKSVGQPQGRWALNVRDDATRGWWIDTLLSYIDLKILMGFQKAFSDNSSNRI